MEVFSPSQYPGPCSVFGVTFANVGFRFFQYSTCHFPKFCDYASLLAVTLRHSTFLSHNSYPWTSGNLVSLQHFHIFLQCLYVISVDRSLPQYIMLSSKHNKVVLVRLVILLCLHAAGIISDYHREFLGWHTCSHVFDDPFVLLPLSLIHCDFLLLFVVITCFVVGRRSSIFVVVSDHNN